MSTLTDEQTSKYEETIAQNERQITALNERVASLSGFQREAVDGRDTIAKLEDELADVSDELAAAKHDAAEARAEAKAAQSKVASDETTIAAAQNLVDAIKALS